jgi:hypothetical protein
LTVASFMQRKFFIEILSMRIIVLPKRKKGEHGYKAVNPLVYGVLFTLAEREGEGHVRGGDESVCIPGRRDEDCRERWAVQQLDYGPVGLFCRF